MVTRLWLNATWRGSVVRGRFSGRAEPHVFEAGQDEREEQDVGDERCQDERPEGYARRRLFRDHRGADVSDEHRSSLDTGPDYGSVDRFANQFSTTFNRPRRIPV